MAHPFGEKSIRKATEAFLAHYHVESNHQGLVNRPISPEAEALLSSGGIDPRERVGGLLKYNRRRAV